MCDPVSAVVAVVGAVGAYQQNKAAGAAADAQKKASTQATAAATAQAAEAKATATTQAAETKAAAVKVADQADQANNLANAKQPDIAGLASRNAMDAKGGQAGTMLTGPTGVDPKTLLLGKSTLLGG